MLFRSVCSAGGLSRSCSVPRSPRPAGCNSSSDAGSPACAAAPEAPAAPGTPASTSCPPPALHSADTGIPFWRLLIFALLVFTVVQITQDTILTP